MSGTQGAPIGPSFVPPGQMQWHPHFPSNIATVPNQVIPISAGREAFQRPLDVRNFPPYSTANQFWMPHGSLARATEPVRGLHPQEQHRGASPEVWLQNLGLPGTGNLDMTNAIQNTPNSNLRPQGGSPLLMAFLQLLQRYQPGLVPPRHVPATYQDNVGLAAGGLGV